MTEPAIRERILLVEDDAALRRTLTELLESFEWSVLTSPDGEHALRQLQREAVDLVITDLKMPGMGGEALLEQVRTAFPEVPVITVTSFGSVEGAVTLTRAGAADYLPKPLRTQALLDSIRRVLERTRERRRAAREGRRHASAFEGIVGRSRPMSQLFQQVLRVAPTTAPVLISGETGAGKELIAQAVHRASGREPFVPLNCGAIPANLLESELFGHVRGAFTGAERDRQGVFEAAHGGTLLLDEIGEMPLPLQAKLLRVLQSGELRRVGEVESRHVDVRVIAATHRDLQSAIREGLFREDLFYRIAVLRLDIPPLRERTADIPLLAERLLAAITRREGLPEKRLTPAAVAALITWPWPGNVRELMNVIDRTAILSGGTTIDVADLPDAIRGAAPTSSAHHRIGQELTLAELEREHILAVLARVGGNRSRAAEVLGVPRRTLYRRLEEYGMLGES
jgi:DNA-binding NtrC family response regulator